MKARSSIAISSGPKMLMRRYFGYFYMVPPPDSPGRPFDLL